MWLSLKMGCSHLVKSKFLIRSVWYQSRESFLWGEGFQKVEVGIIAEKDSAERGVVCGLTFVQIVTAEGEITCNKPRAGSACMVLEERT